MESEFPKFVVWVNATVFNPACPLMLLLTDEEAQRYAEMYPEDILFFPRAADQ